MMSPLWLLLLAATSALRPPVNRPGTALNSATLPLPQQEPLRDATPATAVRDDGAVVLGGDTILEPARSRRRGATKLADVETARETARNGGCFLSFSLRKAKSKVDVDLGFLPPGRILSIARNKRWWITPAFGEVPIESQAVLVEGEEDDDGLRTYSLVLPLLAGQDPARLQHGRHAFRCACLLYTSPSPRDRG